MPKPVKSLEVILTTGRTIKQGITLAGKKLSEDAQKATAIGYLDPQDMFALSLKDQDRIKIKTSEGEMIIAVEESPNAPHPGIIFIPLGIYANWLTKPGEAGIGVPKYKGLKAVIRPTKEEIPTIKDLLDRIEKQ